MAAPGERRLGSYGIASPHRALQSERAHQPLDGAARHDDRFPSKLAPDFASAVDAEVLCVHPLDLGLQGAIAMQPWRQARRIGLAGLVGVVLRRGDRQFPADRLDPVPIAMGVDKGHHHFGRRSSVGADRILTHCADWHLTRQW
jgi:hypothetical protein